MKPVSPADALNNGILLFYHHRLSPTASTIMEHVNSFSRYSRYKVWSVNVVNGFPAGLKNLRFRVIVLDNSLFGAYPFRVSPVLNNYLKAASDSLKIAFFQEEMHNCRQRFAFINDVGIDVVYSLLQPEFFERVYASHTNCKTIRHNMAGYVDDRLLEASERCYKPDRERTVDIGYRGKQLAWFQGTGAQEKFRIADRFLSHAGPYDLVTDIKTAEKDRIYGDGWYRFIGNCRGMLGVEAGTSVFDLDGRAEEETKRYVKNRPNATFEEVHRDVLQPFEDRIYYRSISPRVFECAAFKTCQILYEGRYNDILEPMTHYIPLKKDFSNIKSVMEVFNNPDERARITENAYRDLIASGRYSYRRFIDEFDDTLEGTGLVAGIDPAVDQEVNRVLDSRSPWKSALAEAEGTARTLFRRYMPAQERVKGFIRPALRKIETWKWKSFS